MSFIKQTKVGLGGSWQAPTNDLYDRYAPGAGMFGDTSKQVIMPGVTANEKSRLENISDYVEEKTGQYCSLPQHLIEDVYSMYANEDIKRKETTRDNVVKQKILDRVYNSLTKTVTQGSPLFSQIVTREMAVYMQKVHEELEEEMRQQEKEETNSPAGDCDEAGGQGESDSDKQDNPGEDNDGQSSPGQGKTGDGNQESTEEDNDQGEEGDSSSGAGSGTGQDGDGDDDVSKQTTDKLDEILDKYEKDLDKAGKEASKQMQDLEEKIGKQALQDLSENEPDFLEKIEGIKNILKAVSINKTSIEKILKKILNKSENYFSRKHHVVEESLFDCEACEDLYGLEFLAPMFKNAELMNIVNAKKVYTGKIDLYIDCSYSMHDREEFDGKSIRMSDLVKGMALVLYKMGMIQNLYFFDDDLYHIKNVNEFSILAFNKSGGTNFSRVIDQVIINQENAVVITDGCDRVDRYCKEAFWIGIGKYANFSNNGFDTYRKMKQCASYEPLKNVFEYCKQ